MPKAEINGINIYYNIEGEGIPIIFIHPPLITSAIFTYQLEELPQTCKVITFDIRGHGRSGPSNQEITYSLIAADMIHLLDQLNIKKAVFCGYSTGGSIVLECLLKYPNRALGGIIISGMSEISDWYQKQRISLAIKLAKNKTLPLLSWAISSGNADNKVMRQVLHKEALKGNANNINQYFRYSFHYNCTEQLASIQLPVLLIYGEKDSSFHRYARILHEKLRQSEWKMLKKEKHQLPTKAAVEINKLIADFIKQLK